MYALFSLIRFCVKIGDTPIDDVLGRCTYSIYHLYLYEIYIYINISRIYHIIYNIYIYIIAYIYHIIYIYTVYHMIYIYTCSQHGVLLVVPKCSKKKPWHLHFIIEKMVTFSAFNERPRQARAIATVKLDDEQFSQLNFRTFLGIQTIPLWIPLPWYSILPKWFQNLPNKYKFLHLRVLWLRGVVFSFGWRRFIKGFLTTNHLFNGSPSLLGVTVLLKFSRRQEKTGLGHPDRRESHRKRLLILFF